MHISHQTLKNKSTTTTKSLQLCPTLCDPRDGSPPGFPVPGILQARTLEWVAISFPNGKASACNVGNLVLITGWGRSPGRGCGNPLQYSCLENTHGQRSLAGYSPWGPKELSTTE